MPRPFMFTDDEVRQMSDLYAAGWGTTEIPRRVGFVCTPAQVKYALHKSGISFRAYGLGRPQKTLPLSAATRRMIDGMMLGDGHLLRIKPPLVNSGFSMLVAARHADFVSWVGQYFTQDSVPFASGKRDNSWPGSEAITLSTVKTKEFTELRTRWYPEGTKIVPQDLVLSPELVSAWHMGDGTLHKYGGATLSTNCFTHDDVVFLVSLFADIGIAATVKKHVRGAGGFGIAGTVDWLLYIPRKEGNLKRLFDFIGPCPVPSLRYKWPDL